MHYFFAHFLSDFVNKFLSIIGRRATIGLGSELEMSCQSNGNSSDLRDAAAAGDGGGASNYGSPPLATGWMYINECGQMCGPYIHQQLYEGLSSGFLPEDLPVYPVLPNGSLLNSVPLKYFNQFPDHVSTGFAYLGLPISTPTLPANHNRPKSSQVILFFLSYANILHIIYFIPLSLLFQLSKESCWFYADDQGRKHGPHSLLELFSWHQYGYLDDSTMVNSQL